MNGDFPETLKEARENFSLEDLVDLYQGAVHNWHYLLPIDGPKNRYDKVCSDLGTFIALYNDEYAE